MPRRICCLRSVEMGEGEPCVLITAEGGATAYAGRDEFFARAGVIRQHKEDLAGKKLPWDKIVPGLETIRGSGAATHRFNLTTYARNVTVDDWIFMAKAMRSYHINELAPAAIRAAILQQTNTGPKMLPRRVVLTGRLATA